MNSDLSEWWSGAAGTFSGMVQEGSELFSLDLKMHGRGTPASALGNIQFKVQRNGRTLYAAQQKETLNEAADQARVQGAAFSYADDGFWVHTAFDLVEAEDDWALVLVSGRFDFQGSNGYTAFRQTDPEKPGEWSGEARGPEGAPVATLSLGYDSIDIHYPAGEISCVGWWWRQVAEPLPVPFSPTSRQRPEESVGCRSREG